MACKEGAVPVRWLVNQRKAIDYVALATLQPEHCVELRSSDIVVAFNQ
jgi:hypothetical protein